MFYFAISFNCLHRDTSFSDRVDGAKINDG
jgi:hypothetical protein